ncbi:ArsR/SmtB family transcription factor [Candidatus Binatus sp.]|uniref:ArsR/SmtB family transcription factor n=1 Tax=Candidatus Binatus sp. TaxID=2811406 RepID=UPI003CC69981
MPRSLTSAVAKFAEAAPVFAALGDDTRLQIVARLCGDGPLSIVQLADTAAVSRQAVTKHLHALEQAGLARSSRVGRERIWELQTKRLAEARRYLDQISQDWDAALARLTAFVEKRED